MTQDEAIEAAWPDRWAKANDPRPNASKRRNNLRKHWRNHVALTDFKATHPDARCGNCSHMGRVPHRTAAHRDANFCELDSDFHGYQITSPDSVCTRWSNSNDA